jgi:hypothetical protein
MGLLVWVYEDGPAGMETDFDALVTRCRWHGDSLGMCVVDLVGRRVAPGGRWSKWRGMEKERAVHVTW